MSHNEQHVCTAQNALWKSACLADLPLFAVFCSCGSSSCRFDPESGHTANRGLGVARNLLEPIKMQYPWITYADLYTLAGAVAIEEMGGVSLLGLILHSTQIGGRYWSLE